MKRGIILVLCFVMTVSLLTGCTDVFKRADQSSTASVPVEAYVIYSNLAAPFAYAQNETYAGLHTDLMAAIAADQGFTVDLKAAASAAVTQAVQSGQAHGMLLAESLTDDQKAALDFSAGYFTDGAVLAVPQESAIAAHTDLAGKKVSVQVGTMQAEYAEILRTTISFDIDYCDNQKDVYLKAIAGVTDACFVNYSAIATAKLEQDAAMRAIGEFYNPVTYSFAVKKGQNAQLIEKFNAGLANIKANGKYDEILAKYGY